MKDVDRELSTPYFDHGGRADLWLKKQLGYDLWQARQRMVKQPLQIMPCFA